MIYAARPTMGALGAVNNDQKSICDVAQQAAARNSPVVPGLGRQCYELRQMNIAQGRFLADAYVVDPAYRVLMTEAGERAIARSPSLASALASVPPSRQRGFKMGLAVKAGQADASFATFLKAGLDAETRAGFDLALSGGGVQSSNPNALASGPSDGGGIPTPVIVGGVAVALLGVAAVVYKKKFAKR